MRNTIMILSLTIAIAFVVGYAGIGSVGNAVESLSETLAHSVNLSGSGKSIHMWHNQ